MSKKKGLGRDINRSLDIMEATSKNLREFAHMPLKKGLRSNDIVEDSLDKAINDACETAFSLINAIEDIKHKVKNAKPQDHKSSRFAAKNIVAQFLNDSI